MSNKVAIVTGGGGGIGLAIAKTFVQHNIHTIIIGRNQEKLQAACKQLGPLCHAISQDLSDLVSLPGLVKKIINTYGRIDILVNNAGIHQKKDFMEVTDEEFQRVLYT
ncbi:MAG TPA: SDR family oxidoreductase, partial [Puia sp.]